MNQAVATPIDVRLMNAASVLLGLAFVGLLASLGVSWLMHQNLFRLAAIKVRGDTVHNNAVTLRANVIPRLTGNFFTTDLAQAQSAFESVPWVRKAVVQREFPNSLRVVLQEHRAIAYWGEEGDTHLVNSFGEVFEANQGDVESDDLPLLNGPQGQAALVLDGYRRLSPVFDKLDARIEQLELTGRGSWRTRLDDGATVELGHGSLEEIENRARRFAATLTQVVAKFGKPLESADLRYGNGYAIKLRGVTTTVLGDKTDKKATR
ncbi:MAG: cell division protein FtsQ/DivIB [Polaromonas sp.]|nr:cell division protein FtsQ/DivIB [Polaromonas sp.]